MYHSSSDAAILEDFNESMGGGYSVSPPPPYDFVGMNWAAGRRCTDIPDPGPEILPPTLWADGTPLAHGPHTPTAWRAMVTAHGLPCTIGGKTIGVHPKREN